MSNPIEKSIWSEVPVEENVDLNSDKSNFSVVVYSILLKKIGLDHVDHSNHVQRKAYDFMKWLIEKNKQVLLGFWVCPYYYAYLRRLLKNSYNCYKDSNDPKWSNKLFNEHFTIVEILQNNGVPYEKYGLVVKDYKEIDDMKKFDLTVMNPPYAGKGKPLFMEISKVIYENCLADSGELVSVNPTSVVDNTYDGLDSHSHTLRNDYNGMRVKEFAFDPKYRVGFDASIGTGICVITYAKDGKYNLWSDYVREKRFGKKNWDMRRNIIGKVAVRLGYVDEKPTKGIAHMPDFSRNGVGKCLNDCLVVMSYNRGNTSSDGGHKWDWVTLQSPNFLKIQNEHPDMGHFSVKFDDNSDALNFIKWINTDFIMFIVNHYKTQISNNHVMWTLLPQPPALDGNYSDEVLMKHFNLTQEEMDWIHSEMKDFGWKVNLGKTESELMTYIDEINK